MSATTAAISGARNAPTGWRSSLACPSAKAGENGGQGARDAAVAAEISAARGPTRRLSHRSEHQPGTNDQRNSDERHFATKIGTEAVCRGGIAGQELRLC